MFNQLFCRLRLVCWCLVCVATRADGIFADFTTSVGSFSCSLDYTNAPKTVANFIGLATGERSWLDFTTGLARTQPFYDGLTIDGIFADYGIQAGAANRAGNVGPGYSFLNDHTSTAIRHPAGTLFQLNPSTGTSASEFVIAGRLGASTYQKHTVFGYLISGADPIAQGGGAP